MKRDAKRTWLTITIAEPFPVMFGHVNYDPKTYTGPFYNAGSTWYHLPEHRAWAEFSAKGLRERGYTVTIGEELR